MDKITNMSNDELLKEYKVYDDLIYGKNPCYSIGDLRFYEQLCYELDKREE